RPARPVAARHTAVKQNFADPGSSVDMLAEIRWKTGPRTLRHQHFASWFVMRGGSLQALKEILGHASLAMTMRYAHLAPEHLRNEIIKTERTPDSTKINASINARGCRAGLGISEVLVVVGSPSLTHIELCALCLRPRSVTSLIGYGGAHEDVAL